MVGDVITFVPIGFVSERTICSVKYNSYPAFLHELESTNWNDLKFFNGHALDIGTLKTLQGEDGSIQEGKVGLDFDDLLYTKLMVSYGLNKIYNLKNIENI